MARLRVGDVAAVAGVSRQTIYNEFGDKFGLTKAVAVRLAHRVMDVVEAEALRQPTLAEAAAAGTTAGLRAGQNQPLIRVAVSRREPDDMLSLLTTDAADVMEAVRERIAVVARHYYPTTSPAILELASDVIARLAISHLICPTESIERFARKIAAVVEAITASASAHG